MGHERASGRDVARLLADFGHDLPHTPPPAEQLKERRLFDKYIPRRGVPRRDRGWAPASAPVSVWQMTSDQAPVFWPWISAPPLPPTGVQLGYDELSGSSFYVDPMGWVLRDDIPVSNPNIFQFAKPGMGKSATTKAFILRMLPFGYRTLILGDPKDEYENLCRALGVEPFALGPGMPARINPLDKGPMGDRWELASVEEQQRRATVMFARWLTLLRGLVGSMKIGDLNVPFGPTEADVVRSALETLTGYAAGTTELRETTIPALWYALDNPSNDLVARARFANRQQFYDHTRLLRDSLGQLVKGTLAGLFDTRTNINVDWKAPIQSLSLSRLEDLGDEPIALALLCLNSWGQGMREVADPSDLRILVRDEVWRQLRLGLAAVQSFDASLRLSRGTGDGRGGDINWSNAHKPSDMLGAGAAGSQAATIAKDLLALNDIKILGGQNPDIAADLDAILGLGPMAQSLVTGWANAKRGRALWMVGDNPYQVTTVLHPLERDLTWTNTALEAAA